MTDDRVREAISKVITDADRDWNGNVGQYRQHLVDRLVASGLFAIASLPAPAGVPEGWKLAPVDPTQVMIDAGYWPCVQRRGAKSVWGEMLAASPPPPQSGETGLNWQISDEARRQIDEIERNQLNAMLNARNIVAGSSSPSSEIEALRARVTAFEEALTPSGDTKAAYIGMHHFQIEDRDEDGNETERQVTVPWTTTKEIMATIRARAEAAERKLSELTQR